MFRLTVLGLLLLAVLFGQTSRKRKQKTESDKDHSTSHKLTLPYLQQKGELEAGGRAKHELEAHDVRHEMNDQDEIHEISFEREERRLSRLQELRGLEHSKELEVPLHP